MPGDLFVLSACLFATGVIGFLTRRNAFIVLMSVELMLNSASVLFVSASRVWSQPEGLVAVFIILALAAAEAAVALGALIALYRTLKTEKVDLWSSLRG